MENTNNIRKKNQVEISDILAVIWRRKWLIVIPLIIATGISVVGVNFITPEYESHSIVSIGREVRLSTQVQRMILDGIAAASERRRYDEIQRELQSLQNEITSSPYISQLIQVLKLDQTPDLEKSAQQIRAGQPSLSLEQIKFDLLLNRLREKINVSFVGKDMVRITTQSTNPFLARDMAQNLAEIFITEKMKQGLGSIRVSEDFSYEQLIKYEKDLQDKIDARMELEKEFMEIQLDEGVVSVENRNEIILEIEENELEIKNREEDERRLLKKLSDIPSKNLNLPETNNLKSLKNEIDNHLSSISGLMQKYTWSDPRILNFKTRLFSMINEVEDENEKLVNEHFSSRDGQIRASLIQLFNVRAELDILYSKANYLKLALDDLNEKASLVPEYQARLDQLAREINAARELSERFMEQQKSSEISQALLRESKYRVIEPAKVPLSPFKPDPARIIILGVVLGIVIGGSVALLTELLDKSFRKVEEVEESLGLPVIGVIPKIERIKKFKVR